MQEMLCFRVTVQKEAEGLDQKECRLQHDTFSSAIVVSKQLLTQPSPSQQARLSIHLIGQYERKTNDVGQAQRAHCTLSDQALNLLMNERLAN